MCNMDIHRTVFFIGYNEEKKTQSVMEMFKLLLHVCVKLTLLNESLHIVLFCLCVIFQIYSMLMYKLSFITQCSNRRWITCLHK